MPNIRRSRESWNRSSSFLYDNSFVGNHGENFVWSFVAECAPEAPRKIEKALEIVRRRTSSDLFRDQTDKVALHTQAGIEFLDRYASFVKDRAVVELDYAKQLNGLVRKYLPKKKEEEDPPFTYAKSFNNVLNELQGVANQHELIAENFRQNILTEIATICRDLKENRKTHLTEITRLQQNFDSTVDAMNKMKKEYSKAFKESEAAQFKYDKAEADMNLSRAEVEKAKCQAIAKNQFAEDAKNSYAFQLRKTNDLQTQHFNFLLPNVLEKLREMDETRIKNIRRVILQCAEIERNVLPIIERCLQCMAQHANDIKPELDSQEVVSRFRSGYGLPSDYAFVDLSAEGSSEIIAASPINISSRNGKERKGSATLSRVQSIGIGRNKNLPKIFKKVKNNDESFKEDFSDLQPAQRCKKLQHKLADVEKQIEKKMSQRDGCMKMQTVYRDNPKLGDLEQVELEIDKCNSELSELTSESQKYQAYLQDAINLMNVPINAPLPQLHTLTNNSITPSSTRLVPRPQTHSSGSDASSLCHSNSDVSEGIPEKTSSGGTSASHGSSASPEHRRQCNGDADVYEATENEYGIDAEIVLGTCKALYDFSGGSDGMAPMKEGDEFLLLERDAGDGWTKVRRMDNHMEGFVPTTYLECHFYPI